MRLVEKKCPKCGADLSFDSNSKEVNCSYCKTSYEVERDITDNMGDIINPDFYNLTTKMVKGFSITSTFVTIFIFAVSIIMFVIILIGILPRMLG